MATVKVKVTMQNGTGLGLFVKVDDATLFFSGSGTQTLNLIPQLYISTVGGHEPSSASVKIEFIQGSTVKGSQTFSTPTFFGFIPFTIS